MLKLRRWGNVALLGVSGVTLLLVIAYIVLAEGNRAIQAEVSRRQQFINQSFELGRVNDALIRALAATAVNEKDGKLRDLLRSNGITISGPGVSPERKSSAGEPAAVSTGAQPPDRTPVSALTPEKKP